MAIKTDMSKAYDRVEWEFMEQLLSRFGFHEHWIKCVMHCITSVEYSILINGSPYGKIKPERGLRQGDPLSPYLFILCTEVLISLLRKAEIENHITGIAIARASPQVSHLLFADDSLFFCKATEVEALAIKRVLGEYEKCSGQQINYEKSSIQFGHSVLVEEKCLIHRALGIKTLGGMGSYLGLPESLGGAKTKVFSFVQEKLMERINNWTARFLSKGGKEVLIKSVLTTLPTYVISCFRLPKTIILKLNSAISNFWWSTSGVSRGIHWLKWKKVCKPKSVGGLGFRALEEFNTALLAKQFWRLLDYPNSLFARIFKGRYFKDSTPMINSNISSPSYGWKSIISARSLVSKGIIRRIGNGHSTSVWTDPWIPDVIPRPAKGIEPWLFPNLTVDQFINPHTRSWREVPLRQYLVPEDVKLVLGIHLPRYSRSDCWGWHFNKSGRYSVKSGYKIEEIYSNNNGKCTAPNLESLQAQSWKVKCPGKLKNFMWQIISGCVAVKDKLQSRGMRCDNFCARCGVEGESINHVLFECPPALQTWALSNIPSAIHCFPGTSVWSNMDYLFWRVPNQVNNTIFPWILWYIWKARNEKFFSNIDKDPREILRLASLDAKEWFQANLGLDHNPTISHQETVAIWSAVARPMIADLAFTGYRCFVDGAWRASDVSTGIGWFCFSDSVEGAMCGGKPIPRSLSALHAELEAVLWAMECLSSIGILEVSLATDCSNVLKLFSSPEDWPAFSHYLEDFSRLKSLFSCFSLHLIPRDLNHGADYLARCFRG